MSDDLELTGRRALATGGTQGIGQALVSRSREAGVRVLINVRSSPPLPTIRTFARPSPGHPEFTQELPRKLLATTTKEAQRRRRENL